MRTCPVPSAILAMLLVAGCAAQSAVPEVPPAPSDASVNASPSTALTPAVVPTPVPAPPEPTWPPAGATPTPVPGGVPMPSFEHPGLPVTAGTVYEAPAPGGDLYLLADAPREQVSGPPSSAVFVRLGPDGRVRSGWPVALTGWSCAWEYGQTRPGGPLAADDGSMRALCIADEDPEHPADGGPNRVAIALSPDGRPLDGWPADMRGMGWHTPAAMDDRTLVVAATTTDEAAVTWTAWTAEVRPDGTRRESPHVQVTGMPWAVPVPGRPTMLILKDAGGQVVAWTLEGPVEGWPATLGPGLSGPAAAPDGRTVFAVVNGSSTRTIVLDARGADTGTGSDDLAIVQAPEWSGAGPAGGPAIPLVTPTGRTYLVGQRSGEVVLEAVEPSGAHAVGFPVTLQGEVEEQGRCNGQDTGCGTWTVRPVVAPDGTVYVALRAAGPKDAGSIVAVRSDGTTPPGWPVAAGRAGSTVRELAVGDDGTVYAVVVDRAARPASSVVVALAPDGSERYRAEIVTP